MHYLYLSVAILAEVIATSSLKAAEEFTKPLPSILVVLGYVCAFYFLMLSLRAIPMGLAYAIWSGVGIVLVAFSGYFLYRQTLDIAAILGIALIISGVFTIQVFSKATVH
ncbi:MAG: QacE family quaternary ammonium compound efflux SMR transporter [Gammaproteobacteria bacterium 39-13]|nr:multidrug efflux SMR transporter [Gammaproteobacteria bacterium]OJV89087.1 MAG: QacE family quaternary ammonium compound efflux SMR transporter [Gammaproteobacteria bacterium 39-13]